MPTYAGDASYVMAQGGCYRCGRGDHLVDLDAQIVGEGALALCRGCIGEAAEAAGLHLNAAAVADIQIAHAEERRQFSPDRVAELEAEVLALKAAAVNDLLALAAQERQKAKASS